MYTMSENQRNAVTPKLKISVVFKPVFIIISIIIIITIFLRM
jgi:hypothetical protein